ncbi:Transposase DDE domain group 1 [Carnobacterium alterfunditum]|uniref:Transposase DDE domain group 1 n=1 Tax=Carnobacterium alterfunditum TaxID=28230 RepID=A0A1N6GU62_9LACT|nr:IS1380 family transposase [Carnobacterium alterfunditum]SIN87933.1 Transposase DDE domain group 1 [Carnobacterium alterfunditum]SIN94582.1 Transposase DDE domain group 1 [Carnobacterium alterfunditum]SIN98926.1 Transposase DDE domain group 1 [Carnobacterium alterfunditum]SIO04945.1 Transposase DDE domain group 1 [Carnobacterium alterfunditum]SIO06706.1 Transposase DDE domain group 1 [Carnobacterium alterfunditum]
MAILHENRLLFNSNISVSHSGGNLSSDSGLILVKEFMHTINFSNILKQNLIINDNRLYHKHTNQAIIEQIIFQLIGGYQTDSSADILSKDPIFQSLLAKEQLASQPSISRFWDRLNQENIFQLQEVNQILLDKVRTARNTTEMIFDLDSTHSDTFGNQENSNYNAHYQTNGYHPLVAFEGLTGDLLKAELRSGNVYTSNGVADFVQPLFDHYQETVPVSSILVRADSGFATPELYELCEERRNFYVIRLKSNRKLGKIAEQFISIDDQHDWYRKEVHYASVLYQAKSWSHSRRVCIKSTREATELIARHEFIVTNLSEDISAEAVFQTYSKRGTMENYIKEAKNGFYFDKTDSPRFLENHARMMVSVLAYNMVNFMRTLCFTKETKGFQVSTIRLFLFKVAGKLVHSGRKTSLKLSSSHVYQKLFRKILWNIQHFKWE